MENKKLILAITVTILAFGLWFIPLIAIQMTGKNEFGIVYLPIAILNGLWGIVLHEKYF